MIKKPMSDENYINDIIYPKPHTVVSGKFRMKQFPQMVKMLFFTLLIHFFKDILFILTTAFSHMSYIDKVSEIFRILSINRNYYF